MKDHILRRTLVLGITLLFVGASVVIPNLNGNITRSTRIESLKVSTESFDEMIAYQNYSHTVFVGVGTSQNCAPCHSWNQNLHDAYISGEYDFEYAEMIGFDHDGHALIQKARDWANSYGIGAYPTSILDGDYQRIVGNHPDQLPAKLDACGNRAVANITANMNISWLGNATINVDIVIQNNEGTQYNGYIRAFITEIVSRYDTDGGDPYHFGFLDYAFDTDISIDGRGVYSNSMFWNGNEHEDEHGDDFGDITPNNIQVTMAVYNDNNGYVDETVKARISSNNPPYQPSNPNPVNGSTDVSVNVDLDWTGGDPDGDQVTYDVYLGTTTMPPVVVSNQSITTYDPGLLDFNTTYFWKIVAWDIHDAFNESPLWKFTTGWNNPPYQPSNPNPVNGSTDVSVNVDLDWTGGDPDGDQVTYDVYLGTTTMPPVVVSNQSITTYDPGLLDFNTTYFWKIVAWDIHDAFNESPLWKFTTGWNNPPYQPSNPNPVNGSTDVSVNVDLDWTGGDPDGDQVTYDVYLGTTTMPPVVVSNQSITTYDPGLLDFNTTYFWKIVAWDIHDAFNESPLWKFTTGWNNPPYQPSNPNPVNGSTDVSVNVDLDWTGGDPDGDQVTYDVYFGKSSLPPQVTWNQSGTVYDPGILEFETTYYWRIVAWDDSGESTEGPIWSFTTIHPAELEVMITRPKNESFYLRNMRLFSLPRNIIVYGPIDITVNTISSVGIESVELYINEKLVETFTEESFSYRWAPILCSRYTIKVIAHDENGDQAEDQIIVFKWRVHPLLILAGILILLKSRTISSTSYG